MHYVLQSRNYRNFSYYFNSHFQKEKTKVFVQMFSCHGSGEGLYGTSQKERFFWPLLCMSRPHLLAHHLSVLLHFWWRKSPWVLQRIAWREKEKVNASLDSMEIKCHSDNLTGHFASYLLLHTLRQSGKIAEEADNRSITGRVVLQVILFNKGSWKVSGIIGEKAWYEGTRKTGKKREGKRRKENREKGKRMKWGFRMLPEVLPSLWPRAIIPDMHLPLVEARKYVCWAKRQIKAFRTMSRMHLRRYFNDINNFYETQ